jgi:hypothetical protein
MTLPYNPVTARVQAIAACLCAEIADPDNGVPDVCYCGVMPGAAIAAQYAGDCASKCGMAWVRLVTAYPSVTLGAASIQPARCTTGMGIDVEVGILRCMSVGDERGNMPTLQEQTDAAALQYADISVMWKAILCCDAIPPMDAILGQYQPMGPEGGLVGGAFTLSMAV